MTDADIVALFGGPAQYLCARWARPIAPVLFGLGDDSLPVFRTAIAAALANAGVPLAEIDPESGANLMAFFCRDWAELGDVPDLAALTGIADLPARLTAEDASRYRLFRHDPQGAIRARITLLRVADDHPAALAESVAVNALLTFAHTVRPTPQLAGLIRAAYDPRLPDCATDPAHALRLAARLP